MKFFAARYDLVMFAKRKRDKHQEIRLGRDGKPIDKLPIGKFPVYLGNGYNTRDEAAKAVEEGNKACASGERLKCTLNNGKKYDGPRFRYELVNEE